MAEASKQNVAATLAGRAADLLPAVYDELKTLARHRLAHERPDHTLQATALVHEVYARLAKSREFENKAHFFHAAAEAMRRILIEYARGRMRVKRGGGAAKLQRLPPSVLDLAETPDTSEVLAWDDAIQQLEKESPRSAAVVRLRFYAGLSAAETSEAMDVSVRTVTREWTYARAWLFRQISSEWTPSNTEINDAKPS
jgi:RNA polymerase sigma factor (TIGR02999 family)